MEQSITGNNQGGSQPITTSENLFDKKKRIKKELTGIIYSPQLYVDELGNPKGFLTDRVQSLAIVNLDKLAEFLAKHL